MEIFEMSDVNRAAPLFNSELRRETFDRIIWIKSKTKSVEGSLDVTNYRLIFSPKQSSRHASTFHYDDTAATNAIPSTPPAAHLQRIDIPLRTISEVKKYSNFTAGYGFRLRCKDCRKFNFHIEGNRQNCLRVYNRMDAIMDETCFAFVTGTSLVPQDIGCKNEADNCSAISSLADTKDEYGWTIYCPKREYERLNVLSGGWKFTEANKDYQLCDTYPSTLVIPESLDESDLRSCAVYRSRARVPVLSWLHSDHKTSLTRSSQPLAGVMMRRSSYDEVVLEKIRLAAGKTDSMLHICDARPQANAVANMGMGGGSEVSDALPSDKYLYKYLGIANIHVMRASQEALYKLCRSGSDTRSADVGQWMTRLEETKWLLHIRKILWASGLVAEKLESKIPVLVHCSDGWDRTAQIVSLAMLMLDPYYRTIEGFQVLIEKEWCSFGHKFAERTGGSPYKDRTSSMPDSDVTAASSVASLADLKSPRKDGDNKKETSPVFLQFIDCVYQMIRQFRHAFEFNEAFLITILDELYTCRFGTFLFNSEYQREEQRVRHRTTSLWTYMNSCSENLSPSRYHNPVYLDASVTKIRVIHPQYRIPRLALWTGYYLRWNEDLLRPDQTTRLDGQLSSDEELINRFRQSSWQQSANRT